MELEKNSRLSRIKAALTTFHVLRSPRRVFLFNEKIFNCTGWVRLENCENSTLQILARPTLKSSEIQYGVVGQEATITCKVYAMPRPQSFVWSRRGEVIDVKNNPQVKEIREEEKGGITISRLIILSAQDSDFTDYRCRVLSEIGVVDALLELQRAGKLGSAIFQPQPKILIPKTI